ncbi:putative oxidoreductase Tda3p [Trichomonascus vanleenenianus]|uniref:Tda3p n=1 Tax=Trichomonascus vanleenenianus TaxID=2268995 RepID=UPI003ECA399A
MAKKKQEIVIVGAGIIGACTAYYLTRHPDFDPEQYHVTVLEARRPAGGASGKAGGLLATWAFPQQIVPLSFKLHQQLADEYNGEEEWGYRRVTTLAVNGTITSATDRGDEDEVSSSSDESINRHKKKPRNAQSPKHSAASKAFPPGLDWLKPGVIEDWSQLSDTSSTAQVHPYKFTTYLLRKAVESGSVDLVIGKVEKIRSDQDRAVGVQYLPRATESNPTPSLVDLDADHIVLTLGPWTSKLLPGCPISGLRAHSITIAPERPVSAHAMFTELKIVKSRANSKIVSPEIYPRRDEVYVCGEGDNLAPVPESTDEVEVIRDRCDDLFVYAGGMSNELKNGRILRRQACYLPVVDVPSCSGPFIGPTSVSGLYLASGHSCWGINNAPGTGKVMAEIILEGAPKSASIAGLEPSKFFDVYLD